MEKNLLIDMGVSLPEGTNWDEVAMAITEAIIAIVEQLDGECGGSVHFQEFDYEAIEAELADSTVNSAVKPVTVHG
jgi:hypothetical protein